MKQSPKLSIIVGTYNRCDALANCLEYVTQTTVDCEILVWDDASGDNTPAVAERFAGQDERIRYFRQPANVGGLPNFMSAHAAARGDYVSDLGDDDFPLPGNYERKVAILDAYPKVGMVWSFRGMFDWQSRQVSYPRRSEQLTYSYIGTRNEFFDLLSGNYVPATSVVWRRRLQEELGLWDEENVPATLGDWDLWLRYSYHAPTAYLHEPLVMAGVGQPSRVSADHVSTTVGMIDVWRKWLVTNPDPPTVEPRLWQRMHEVFLMCLNMSFSTDQVQIQYWLREFDLLQAAYHARAGQVFAQQTRQFDISGAATGTSTRTVGDAAPVLVWRGSAAAPDDQSEDLRLLLRAQAEAGPLPRLEEVSWAPIQTVLPDAEAKLLRDLAWTPLPVGGGYVHVMHAAPARLERDSDATLNVGRTAFGTDGLPPDLVERCNAMDELWVPSPSNLETFGRAGVQPNKLRLLPPCLDVTRFSPDVQPDAFNTGRTFNFLSVCDWDRAHGWDVLLRAWSQEFRPDEDVALVLAVFARGGQPAEQIGQDIQRELSSCGVAQIAPLNVNQLVPGDPNLARWYRTAQAYVQPSRADAWGRHLLEAMSTGLPAIGTGWGGALGFMTPTNSFPLEYALSDVSADAVQACPDFKGQRWAEPSIEHLRELMRTVYRDRGRSSAVGTAARAAIVSGFGLGSAARGISALCAPILEPARVA